MQFEFNPRFPGQYADIEDNLNNNGYRDYNAALGRYQQSDPIGLLGGLNTFAYVGGSPIKLVDPRGLDNPGMGPYQLPLGWVDPSQPARNYRAIKRKYDCACSFLPSRALTEAVAEDMLPLGAGGGGIGAAAGAATGGYYGIAVEGAELGRKGYQITRILVSADSVLSGMVAGGVLGASGGLVLGAAWVAADSLPPMYCYCHENNMCKAVR